MTVDIKNLTRDAQERIRNLAYLMWDSAGRQQNMALQYWLDAEREIFSSMQAATDAIMPGGQQRQKAKQTPDQPSANDALEQPRNHAAGDPGQDEEAAAQPSRSHPPLSAPRARMAADAVKKAQTKAAAGAPAERPAPRRTGGRKKTTK